MKDNTKFFDEEPHLSLWNRYGKDRTNMRYTERFITELRKVYKTPHSFPYGTVALTSSPSPEYVAMQHPPGVL